MLNKHRRNAGVTLVELIVAMVIMGVALAGMVAVYTATTRSSTDPVIVQQMEAIADNLMEEILMKPFAPPAPPAVDAPGARQNGPRVNFDNVADYDRYDTGAQGIRDVEGNVIPGLESYQATVAVYPNAQFPNVALTGIPKGDALQVVVTVTNLRAPQNDPNRTLTLTGWRTKP